MKSTVTTIATASLFWAVTSLMPGVALAAVSPGTYTDPDFEDNPNHPGSADLKAGNVECVVNEDLDVDCAAYTLSGVGHTNADVSLTANYTAIVDCFNPGNNPNNPIESHETTFSPTSTATVVSSRNGQLRVPAQSASFSGAPIGCPNENWTPTIRESSVELVSFTYTITFAGFNSPYITISAP